VDENLKGNRGQRRQKTPEIDTVRTNRTRDHHAPRPKGYVRRGGAALYRVETKHLLRAVRRNRDRFPADFSFELTPQEFTNLKRQFGTSSFGWGERRTRPWAFTEQGMAMLSRVLRSKRAVLVNIEIMRAFVRLRELLATHADLARRIDELEKKYDHQFAVVFDAIRQLMAPADKEMREMGYHTLIKK
jgi:hypothetical protein